jgi:hypothetical protein
MLSNEQVKAFQNMYLIRFGKKISREEAIELGEKLILLMKLIYKPVINNNYERE